MLSFIPQAAERARQGRLFKAYKTALQEIVQKNRQETLEYRLGGSSGPDHDKTFTMQLLLNSNVFAEGKGHSKKEAEQMAAKHPYLDATLQKEPKFDLVEVFKTVNFPMAAYSKTLKKGDAFQKDILHPRPYIRPFL